MFFGKLKQFYVLTTDSVYVVSDAKNDEGVPLVKKIFALPGPAPTQSVIPIDWSFSVGTHVYVSKEGIQMCVPSSQNPPNWSMVSKKTSPVSGLFLLEIDVLDFIGSEKISRFNRGYRARETSAVLQRIPYAHPVFVIDPVFRKKYHG